MLYKYSTDFVCTYTNSIKDIYKILNTRNINLICINSFPFTLQLLSLISDIKKYNSNIKIFGVLPPQISVISECINNGLDEYVLKDSNECLECRIFKLLNSQYPLVVDVKTYKYIHYIPNQQEMYIKQTKIHLTPFECIFINYTINNNGYCNISNFEKYYSLLDKKVFRKDNMVVSINRLRKKIYLQTGYRVIKCKYGFGYYLTI